MNEIYQVSGGYGKYLNLEDESEISEYDIKDIISIITTWDFLVYSYAYADYEGGGNMIIKKDGKFMHHDMSHCSCYGPIEHLKHGPWHDTFDSLVSTFSEDLKKECTPLLLKIKELEDKNNGK